MLDKAEARHAIEGLIYGYAEAIDEGDLDRIAELFSEAVVWPIPGAALRGGAAVAEMFARHTIFYDTSGPADPRRGETKPHTRHVVTNLRIDVADDGLSATARSYVIVFQAWRDFALQPVFRNRYRDRFVFEADRWRFAEREMLQDEFGRGDTSRHLYATPRSPESETP